MNHSSVSKRATAAVNPSGVSFLSAASPAEQDKRTISARLISNSSATASISASCFAVKRIGIGFPLGRVSGFFGRIMEEYIWYTLYIQDNT
ncbi:MAG: hypothetical protein ACLVGY_11120 [Akkermansia muciniphila]